MEQHAQPRIIAADIFGGGLLIAFQDQRTAHFPAAFLYEAISQVQEILDCGPEDEPELMLHAEGEKAYPTEDGVCG